MSVQDDLELYEVDERDSWLEAKDASSLTAVVMAGLVEAYTPFTAKYSSKKDLIVIKHPDTGKTVAKLQIEDAAFWVDGVVAFRKLVAHFPCAEERILNY